MISRRQTLALGAGAAATLGFAPQGRTQAVPPDTYATEAGALVVQPVEHASLVLATSDFVVHVDPVGGAERYAGLPAPGLILITHEHGDHFDPPTLTALAGASVQLLVNPAVLAKLPETLRSRATAIANGEGTTAGSVVIEAIPAYNTTADRLQYHPQGRDNGYVLTMGATRVYVAGDTEDIPEMRALRDIDIAFVPMNLPYTMTVEQAADGVAAFQPARVYPYHYGESDLDAFAERLAQSGAATEVIRRDWYAAR